VHNTQRLQESKYNLESQAYIELIRTEFKVSVETSRNATEIETSEEDGIKQKLGKMITEF